MSSSTTRPLAVITGASTGIGYHLARVFAQNGFDLLVTADEPNIMDAARELESLGSKVYSVQADLAKDEEVERLWREVLATGRPVDTIALNAGTGISGDFARETDLNTELSMIDLNVKATVHLAKLAARQMVGRRTGRILITSSVAGTMPAPMQAVYGATKAFDLEFAQSLHYELKDSGITVTALKPGATDTEFFRRGKMEDTKVAESAKKANDPAKVAQQAFEALMRGEQEVFAESLSTKLTGALGKFIPDSVQAKQYEKQAAHGTAEKEPTRKAA